MVEPVLIVYCSCPDVACAETIAQQLVTNKQAACVNVLPTIRSFYRWQGEVECDDEVLLLIKTTHAAYPSVESTISQLHPYELPEIIAVESARGLPDYLQWVHDSSSASP